MSYFRQFRIKIENQISTYPVRFIVGILCLLFSVALVSPVVELIDIKAPIDLAGEYAFGDTRTVGQEFVLPVGLREIRIPFRKVLEEQEGPLILHLRDSYFGEDIRSSVLFKPEGEIATFVFDPVYQRPRTVVWVLEAPHSPDKSFAVYREKDEMAFAGAHAFVKGVPIIGNFGFTLVRMQPALIGLPNYFNLAMPLWSRKVILVGLIIGGLLTVFWRYLKILFVHRRSLIVFFILVVSAVAHWFFASQMPLINDEGAYFQDAAQLKVGQLPFRDYLTKGPLYIALLWAWQNIVSHSIVALRMFSILASLITTWLTIRLALALRLSWTIALTAGLFVALSPTSVALTTPLLLQVVSVPLSLGGLVMVIRGARENRRMYVALGAMLMAAAYFTRVSSMVVIVVGLFLLLTIAKRERWRLLGVYIGVGLAVLVAVAGVSLFIMGPLKTAVLLNFEALLISRERASDMVAVREPIIRAVTIGARPLWRGASWIIAGLFSWLVLLLPVRKKWVFISGSVLISLLLYQIALTLLDTNYLLVGNPQVVGYLMFLLVFGFPFIVWLVRLFYVRKNLVTKRDLAWIIPIALWLLGLIIVYGQWQNFIEAYIIEFIVPISMISSWAWVAAINLIWKSPMKRYWIWYRGAMILMVSVLTVFGYVTFVRNPFAGNISQSALNELVAVVKKEVPQGTAIFTAQPAVTAFSGRPIVFSYSHPGWYLSEQVGEVVPELRSLYFMEPEQLTNYLREESEFIVTDRRTNQIYFNGYPERQIIRSDFFELIAEVENEDSSTPFQLFRRR